MPCGRCGRAREEAKKWCSDCYYKGYTLTSKDCKECGGKGVNSRDPSKNCSYCHDGKETKYCTTCEGSTNNEVCTQSYHKGAME